MTQASVLGPRVGVFDAGLGGIPLAAQLRLRRPDVELVYLADSARRPYGPRPNDEICRFVWEVTEFFEEAGCDVWVIACNTASVVADQVPSRRARRVDMIQAVVGSVSKEPLATPLGLIATAGTVASGVLPRALSHRTVVSLATEELLRLAETGSTDHDLLRQLASEALEYLRAEGCAEVVLACTDYTCILDDLTAVADGLRLIDPLQTALESVISLLPQPVEDAARPPADRLCLTGPHPVDPFTYAFQHFGLYLPPAEVVALPTPGVDHAHATIPSVPLAATGAGRLRPVTRPKR